MKTVLIVCLVAFVAADTKYDPSHDDLDLSEVLGNERLLISYTNCLVDKGPCTPEVKQLKGSRCDPSCKNNGICIDTNTCHCPANFQGKYCESEKKPCLTYPPLPKNSGWKCTSELCTITCIAGHKFIDGMTVANMRCVDGQWQPTRADFSSIPDCEPECDPPCSNGGVCLSINTCQCPTEYRGPQCQYSTSVCDFRKLAFNGNYKCKGNDKEFSCKLSCPPGATGSTAFADQYTCLYSTGTYTPQPIPHCVFNDVVVVTPSNYLSGYSSINCPRP